jgi:phosphoribosylglycinamide formyltransferase-1
VAKVGIGVLASGRGSNFEALARAAAEPGFNGEVRLLVANVPGAGALERAAALGVPAITVNHRDYPRRADFERAVIAEFDRRSVELVCLAGFMRVLTPVFVRHYPDRVLNVHPSLLPAFAGLQGMAVHTAVLEHGCKVSGCTVHIVSEAVDAGPIVVQRAVPVLDDDDPEKLAARVLVEEHRAYVEAVRLFCDRRITVQGRKVRVIAQ